MSETLAQLGKYAVESVLAITNFSEVYLARQESQHYVVLKRLRPELAQNTSVRLSFQREANLLAEVSHPHVVKVLHVGEEQGVPFSCLEYVEGTSLKEILQKEPLSIENAILLLLQIADGLARVHEKGIVHADLKPSNLLVQTTAKPWQIKIADFGLAATAGMRRQGIVGTPHYMAPEQTGLVDWSIDERTDLYALGVIAYEMVAGRAPFDAGDPLALLAKQVSEVPVKLNSLRPNVPPILERMIDHLLEKNPAQRYRSAISFTLDLKRLRERLQSGDASPEFLLDTSQDYSVHIGQVFVGRQVELERLQKLFERARSGRPSTCLVGGVAGIGKSTLLREFQNRSIIAGARFGFGKCYPFSKALPFFVIQEALASLWQRIDAEPSETKASIFERVITAVGDLAPELVKLAPTFASLFPNAGTAVYLGEGRDRIRFHQVFARVLEALAPLGQPLVLLLEDLQWADDATLEALEALVTIVRDSSLLIVSTYRSEEVSPTHPFHRFIDPKLRELLELGPLTSDQMRHLVAEVLRQPAAAIPDNMVSMAAGRSGGNPLFVGEILKAWLLAHVIEVQNGKLIVSETKLAATPIPNSVVDIVLARVSQLSNHAQRLLGVAALIGGKFDLDTIAKVAASPPRVAFDAVQEGIEQKFLLPQREGAYHFVHDRIQEACARLIPMEERKPIHQQIVQALEMTQSEHANEDQIYNLAEHACLAEDSTRAWQYCRLAGERARAQYANVQAANYYERSIFHSEKMSDPPPADEVRAVSIQLAEVQHLLGHYDQAIALYESAFGCAEQLEEKAKILSKLALTHQGRGNYGDSEKALTQALNLLGVALRSTSVWNHALGYLLYWTRALRGSWFGYEPSSSRRSLVVDILTRLWSIFGILDAKRVPYIAIRLMAEAVQLGPSRELSLAHRQMSITLVQKKKPPWKRALKHGHKAVEIARKANAHLEAAVAALYTSDIYCWSARYREALPWLESARSGLSALGNMWELGNTHIFSYLALKSCGRLDDALSHAHALAALGEKLKAAGTIANGNQKIAEICFLKGDEAKAESHLATSLNIAEERKLNFERYSGYKIRGLGALLRGDWRQARLSFEAAITLNETPGVSFFQAYVSDSYLGYAEAFLKDDDYIASSGGLDGDEGKRVRRYIQEALRREKFVLSHLGLAHRTHALERWRSQDHRGSRAAFRRALEVFLAQARPLDLAWTQLEAASALAERYREEAEPWLKQALATAKELGVKPLVLRSQRELSRLGFELAIETHTDAKSVQALGELQRISQLLIESKDPDVLLDQIVDSAVQLLHAERGFLFIHEENLNGLTFRVGRSVEGKFILENEANLSRTVVERVDSTSEGLAVSDTAQDADLREQHSVSAYNLRSVLCAPLLHASEKLGVLYLDSQVTTAIFGSRELELLTSLAAQAALALSNARQFSTIQGLNRELDQKVLERTREVESAYLQLEGSMEKLQNTTLKLVEAQRAALEKEMEVARQIQLAMVPPKQLVNHSAARFIGVLEPASFCGGDLWAFVEHNNKLVFFIGDVTGHGLGSAMVTNVARSCIDTVFQQTQGDVSLDRLFAILNNVIFGLAKKEMVMTAFAAQLDPKTHTMSYCVAGHNPQFLFLQRPEGIEIASLFARSTHLGYIPDKQFEMQQIGYSAGDRLFLYTDGVTECIDPSGNEFGTRKVRQKILETLSQDAEQALEGLYDQLKNYMSDKPADDDMTFVIAELK